MHYNVHTHDKQQQKNVLSIENISVDFDQDIVKRKVSLGLHPWYLRDQDFEWQLADLKRNVSKPEVLAIGECGLDKRFGSDWALQLSAFREQILLAEKLNKPLIIHCVKAFDEVLLLLEQVTVPVIFHGINNKLSTVQRVIDSGHYLSFGKSIIGFNMALQETFRATPIDRIFLETDDSEKDIHEIYKSAALLRGISEKEIVLQIETNFLNVFGK